MRLNLDTWDRVRIFTMLMQLSITVKIKVMLYTLKVHVEHGHIENIWAGNEMSDAIHYEAIAIKHWGKDSVWICNNMDEIAVG